MSTTTTIHVYTSVATAVRSCQEHGWIEIGIDLTKWTEEERELLIERVVEGERGGYRSARYGSAAAPHDLADPTPTGLLAHVKAGLVEQAKQQAETKRAEAERAEAVEKQTVEDAAAIQAEVDRLQGLPIEKLLKEPAIHEYDPRVRLNGIMPLDWPRLHRAMERLGSPPPKDTHDTHEFDAFAISLLGRDEEITMERARLAAAKEVERVKQEAAEAAKAIAVAKLEREILEHIDPTLLPRYDAGYLPNKERDEVLRSLLLPIVAGMSRVSLRCSEHRHDSVVFDGLTDDQYNALTTVQARAKGMPETPVVKGLTVEARKRHIMDGEDVMIVHVSATICGHKVGIDRMLETPLATL